MKILVADDRYCLRIIRELKQGDFSEVEFVEASTAEEAVEKLEGGLVPDLFICDQHFDDAGGIKLGTDAIQWVRELKRLDFPIIFFTSDQEAGRLLKPEWKVKVCVCLPDLPVVVKEVLG